MSHKNDLIKNWFLRPFINNSAFKKDGVVRVAVAQAMGDAMRGAILYHNCFRFLDLSKIEICFPNEKYMSYWRPLYEVLNKYVKSDVKYSSSILPDCVDTTGIGVGYSFIPKIPNIDVPDHGVIVTRKKEHSSSYLGGKWELPNLSHRLYPFEFWLEMISLLREKFGDIIQFHDAHLPDVPVFVADTACDVISHFQNCKFFFGEISYGHQVAAACGIPFLTCQAFDPDWTLKFCSNFIADLKSRNIIFHGPQTLLLAYVSNRSVMMESIECELARQLKVIEAFDSPDLDSKGMIQSKHCDIICESRPGLWEYFTNSTGRCKLVLYDDKIESLFSMPELDRWGNFYLVFKLIFQYIDLTRYFNYLAEDYQYIEFSKMDMWGYDAYGYVESLACKNGQKFVYQFNYHLGLPNNPTPVVRHIDHYYHYWRNEDFNRSIS